jgi:hypothetical protein
MIRAYCKIPAYDDARFDATPWFEEATPAAILGLVREEWTGRPARDLANAVARIDGYSRLDAILGYKRSHRAGIDGKPLTIEIHVDPVDALAWIAEERPDVHAKILAEFCGDAAACERTKAYWADPKDPDEANYLRRAEPAPAPR